MAAILPIAFVVLFLTQPDETWRERFVRTAVLLGVIVVLLTEVLSAFGGLQQQTLFWSWVLVLALYSLIRRTSFRLPSFDLFRHPRDWFAMAITAVIVAILGVIEFTALASPPNSADAMAYHLPRVLYWSQQGSVNFFATPYLNQIMLAPIAEYFMLHSVLLSGHDHFVNLGQWFGCVTAIVGVSLIAKEFGAATRGQVFSALFCATLPNGILQASGAKNDYLLTAWLVVMVWYLLRAQSRSDILMGAFALALAVGTKATAFLFAPAFLLLAIHAHWNAGAKRIAQACGVAVAAILLIDGWQFARNIDLSGSPLGFDSAQGNGLFRWKNESFGVRNTASNLLRHTSEQLGGRPEWNQRVYDIVANAHRLIRADLNSEETTFRNATFRPPSRANHEADAPNTWHLAALLLCGLALLRWRKFKGLRLLAMYWSALAAGCLLFCLYLKWQPYMSRLWLPLFVLGAPLAGFWAERIPRVVLQGLLVLFFLNGARLPLFENWTRRLTGENSILRTERDANYFNDMSQWNNRASYLQSVELLAGSACRRVGIDANILQLEYPLQALLLERVPDVQFVHTGVTNVSRKYDRGLKPCAVVCLSCAGVEEKRQQYRGAGEEHQAGTFLVYLPR